MVEVHQDSYSTAKALSHSAGGRLILMQQKILVYLGNLFLGDLTNPISKIKINTLTFFRIIDTKTSQKQSNFFPQSAQTFSTAISSFQPSSIFHKIILYQLKMQYHISLQRNITEHTNCRKKCDYLFCFKA